VSTSLDLGRVQLGCARFLAAFDGARRTRSSTRRIVVWQGLTLIYAQQRRVRHLARRQGALERHPRLGRAGPVSSRTVRRGDRPFGSPSRVHRNGQAYSVDQVSTMPTISVTPSNETAAWFNSSSTYTLTLADASSLGDPGQPTAPLTLSASPARAQTLTTRIRNRRRGQLPPLPRQRSHRRGRVRVEPDVRARGRQRDHQLCRAGSDLGHGTAPLRVAHVCPAE
jgi:hypothetical protein